MRSVDRPSGAWMIPWPGSRLPLATCSRDSSSSCLIVRGYGYNLLGCAIEGASGMPYAEYIQQYVLQPAGVKTIQPDNPDTMPVWSRLTTSME